MQTDVISSVLQAVRLKGAVFFDIEASPPWVAEAPPARELVSRIMPQAQSLMEYHIVASGSCWAALASAPEDAVRLDAGSILVFPHGDPHIMGSRPGMRAKPDYAVYRLPEPGETLPYSIALDGGETGGANLICGFLGCDARPFNPLLAALPPMLHVANGYDTADSWLGNLIRAAVTESRSRRIGADSVLARLSELIFVEVIRRYIEGQPSATSGWLAALTDPQLGRALQLLHEQPSNAWTLDLLARRAGLSRTRLVEQFTAQLGVAPMSYLTNWRMQMAASLLASDHAPIVSVAMQVGYASEAAFSRAFSRCLGVSPSTWRKRQLEAA